MPQPPSIAVMAHVLITGSADGLGLMAARDTAAQDALLAAEHVPPAQLGLRS